MELAHGQTLPKVVGELDVAAVKAIFT